MNWRELCACAGLLTVAGAASAADCSREDVDHYLDRGFTPQQVVALCRSEAASAEALPSAEQAGYWRDVIDAVEVQLEAGALYFRRDQCVKYDRPNFAEQRKKACGKVSYRIGLAGLQVEDSTHKLLFWGQNTLKVRSPQIERQFELGQAELPARDQRLLAEELESGDIATIPLREGVAVDGVGRRLQDLADTQTKKTAP